MCVNCPFKNLFFMNKPSPIVEFLRTVKSTHHTFFYAHVMLVTELSITGRVLTTLQATDIDGDPITFSIDINDYFDIRRVNSTTVEVVSVRGIDYERNSNVQFIVTATDENSNSRVSAQDCCSLWLVVTP